MSYKTVLPHIPDKVEIVVTKIPPVSPSQLKELEYYLRTHRVTDDGYDMVAQHHTALCRRIQMATSKNAIPTKTRYIQAKDRTLPAVKMPGGYWKAGHFHIGSINGPALIRSDQGKVISVVMNADTIVSGVRTDSLGTYRGQMNAQYKASGHGTYEGADGTHYEGSWENGLRHGFGFESSPMHPVHVGFWKKGRFLGERLKYTHERIYGIDVSRYQHEIGRRRYSIDWDNLRITSLGHRHNAEGRSFPVSFAYIKSTESTSIRNRYFLRDYLAARQAGIHVGAYHFFSLSKSPLEQAMYFVNHTLIREDDFPPVLDVEPSDAQIRKIGGDDELMHRIKVFLEYVERRTHKRPILYVSQGFINNHMKNADDIKHKYNVWIARYSEYKPYVKLAFWQLSADGRVAGIKGDVDINVFNGYQAQWKEFLDTWQHK